MYRHLRFTASWLCTKSASLYQNRGSDRPNTQLWSATITLKAFANFSPGVALWQTRGKTHPNLFEDATLKGLPRRPSSRIPSQLLQSCDQINVPFLPRVSKQTLGLN
jgi:hypothetical protein